MEKTKHTVFFNIKLFVSFLSQQERKKLLMMINWFFIFICCWRKFILQLYWQFCIKSEMRCNKSSISTSDIDISVQGIFNLGYNPSIVKNNFIALVKTSMGTVFQLKTMVSSYLTRQKYKNSFWQNRIHLFVIFTVFRPPSTFYSTWTKQKTHALLHIKVY